MLVKWLRNENWGTNTSLIRIQKKLRMVFQNLIAYQKRNNITLQSNQRNGNPFGGYKIVNTF